MKINDKKKLLDLLNNNEYEKGFEIRRLLFEYYEDDDFVGDNPELLSLFGQRENMNISDRIVDSIEDEKLYKFQEAIIPFGDFIGEKTYLLILK